MTVPRIHEGFTVLPCPRKPGTTLAIEGCTERKILRTDAAINGQAQAIFALLSPAGRRAFVAGERSWLAYRKATCSADASPYAGGTAQPLVFGSCVVEQNRRHLAALAALKRDLQRVG